MSEGRQRVPTGLRRGQYSLYKPVVESENTKLNLLTYLSIGGNDYITTVAPFTHYHNAIPIVFLTKFDTYTELSDGA